MLTRQEAIKACMTLPGAYEDYPFDDPNWTIMRHHGNRKMFAAIYARQGHIWLNLKADPMWGDLWKQNWPAVVPAYHMNKQHWISVLLPDAPDDVIEFLTNCSFEATRSKRKLSKIQQKGI